MHIVSHSRIARSRIVMGSSRQGRCSEVCKWGCNRVIKQPPLFVSFVGKSLSDDQTGAASLQHKPCVVPKRPSRDSSTQSDEVPQEPELTAESTEAISAATTGGLIVLLST